MNSEYEAGDICPDCEIMGVPGALCPRHARSVDLANPEIEWSADLFAGRVIDRLRREEGEPLGVSAEEESELRHAIRVEWAKEERRIVVKATRDDAGILRAMGHIYDDADSLADQLEGVARMIEDFLGADCTRCGGRGTVPRTGPGAATFRVRCPDCQRKKQADRVMPKIGPLLDMWEGLGRDQQDYTENFAGSMARLRQAMEGAL